MITKIMIIRIIKNSKLLQGCSPQIYPTDQKTSERSSDNISRCN